MNRIQDSGDRMQDAGFASLMRMRHKGGGRAESGIRNPGSSKGFSLVSAIFLLVVIAALGTFAVTLSTTQHQSATLDVMGARAYQASRAGIEWGAYQVISSPASIGCPVGGASNPVAMPAAPSTLAAFTVDVSCWSYVPVSEAANTVTMYRLISTATQGTAATPDYVERQMTVTIAQ
jgi:MSHA biogenesis protein MshP